MFSTDDLGMGLGMTMKWLQVIQNNKSVKYDIRRHSYKNHYVTSEYSIVNHLINTHIEEVSCIHSTHSILVMMVM